MPGDIAAFGAQLGFTPAWYALGVVDQAFLERARARWDTGEDEYTEHYRYRVFGEFVASHRPLSPGLAVALYQLGEADEEPGMGGSMMAAIVWSPECPEAVLDMAAASGQRHLIRAVERRRAVG